MVYENVLAKTINRGKTRPLLLAVGASSRYDTVAADAQQTECRGGG